MSVSKFSRDNNVYFMFDVDMCLVKYQVSHETLLEVSVGNDGLYEFPYLQLTHSPKFSSSTSSSTNKLVMRSTHYTRVDPNLPNVWHLRLGHPNIHAMKLVLQSYHITFFNKNSSLFCTACYMGKANKLHSPTSHTTYPTPLEFIYSDLWGRLPVLLLLVIVITCLLWMLTPRLLRFTFSNLSMKP